MNKKLILGLSILMGVWTSGYTLKQTKNVKPAKAKIGACIGYAIGYTASQGLQSSGGSISQVKFTTTTSRNREIGRRGQMVGEAIGGTWGATAGAQWGATFGSLGGPAGAVVGMAAGVL